MVVGGQRRRGGPGRAVGSPRAEESHRLVSTGASSPPYPLPSSTNECVWSALGPRRSAFRSRGRRRRRTVRPDMVGRFRSSCNRQVNRCLDANGLRWMGQSRDRGGGPKPPAADGNHPVWRAESDDGRAPTRHIQVNAGGCFGLGDGDKRVEVAAGEIGRGGALEDDVEDGHGAGWVKGDLTHPYRAVRAQPKPRGITGAPLVASPPSHPRCGRGPLRPREPPPNTNVVLQHPAPVGSLAEAAFS